MNERDLVARIKPGRSILGMSAVLLVHRDHGSIDWNATENHIGRTVAAGLTPAVNMDTGYVQLLDRSTRTRVLDMAGAVTGGDFVAGAYVDDGAGDPFDLGAYVESAHEIAARGGTPVIFPSHGLNGLDDDGWAAAMSSVGGQVGRFIAFELGPMFVPYGKIVSLEAFRALLEIPACIGAKHSSLDRSLEWDRLALRDSVRSEFRIFTGNDLAIDMVMYGSDYLLGLSTFAPDLFARRDRLWKESDPAFHTLNDLLQYLGQFAFRPPVPAYRHDAAVFLQLRGWAAADATPNGVPRRPDADRAVLADILERLEEWA